MNSGKKWGISFLVIVLALLLCLGAVTAIVDPFFHYHAPLDNMGYLLHLNNQRYLNDGILKHFDYDAVITGTSMTENFKTSEFDAYFGTNSVKVPSSGGSYMEINNLVKTAIEHNPDIKYVLRGLDYGKLLQKYNAMEYDENLYPTYLYDSNIFNDVNYLFNKTVFFNYTMEDIFYTRANGKTTSFDVYSNWMYLATFGKDSIDSIYKREEKSDTKPFTDEDGSILSENISKNITETVAENPQIEFYLFFPPYSIYYWDKINRDGTMEKQLEAEKKTIEMLLEYDNIHLFSFFDDYDITCNLNNYKDTSHYSEDINSYILDCMSKGEHQLTKGNYLEYCDAIYDFYTNYDYDTLFEEN